MQEYKDLVFNVLNHGTVKEDRTGVGIVSTFGYQMRVDLQKGFPLLTTKKVHFKSVLWELLWFLTGSTNTKLLEKHGVKIWDAWKTEDSEIGPMYGKQWTSWETPSGTVINQIEEVINIIKTNPTSRRMLVTAWNPADLPDESIDPQSNVKQGKMALAACHAFFQFYVFNGKLSCQVYQRSADVFLGVPFNIASYALLTHMVAQQTDLDVGELIWIGGDVHIYTNHIEQLTTQMEREERKLPTIEITRANSIFDYSFEDFTLIGYNPHPRIKGAVAI